MKLPLVVAALIGWSSTVRADYPPESASGWLQIRTGLSFADTLTLDSFIGLESNGDPGFVLGIGAHWRTSRLDFGAIFESLASWSFPGVSRDQRVGGQFRAAAHLRWRYIEDAWGALYIALSPGIMAFDHSPQVRFQAAQTVGASTTDRHTLGFSMGFDFGLLFYLTDELALALNLDVMTCTTSLDTDVGPIDLDMVRGLFTVGLEWRLH